MKRIIATATLAMATIAWAGWPGTTATDHETESGWPKSSTGDTGMTDTILRCSVFSDLSYRGPLTLGQRDPRIDQMIEEIVKVTGLEKNFEIYSSPEVANAGAGIKRGGIRVIAYNPNFLNEMIRATGTDWSVKSILAHEVGHHLQGHTLQEGGSRPPIELEADKYSGAAMRWLGGTLEQAQVAMENLAPPQGSATHPGRRDRLIAIAAGWNEAGTSRGASGQVSRIPTSPFPTPNQTPFPQPNNVGPAAACCGPTGPMCRMTMAALPVGYPCTCYLLGQPIVTGVAC